MYTGLVDFIEVEFIFFVEARVRILALSERRFHFYHKM